MPDNLLPDEAALSALRERVAELEKEKSRRCEHCGSDRIYSGPPDCPGCGAPVCCQVCCKENTLTMERDALRERVAVLQEQLDIQTPQSAWEQLTDERDALRAENALLKAEVRRCHALGKKSHSFTGSLASKAIFEEIPAAVAELLKESASATACAIKERRWYRHDEITRDIHGGLCWWWWNGDDMFPVVIGYSPTTQRWYAERGQWGWTDARYLDEMGGLWTPCVKPHDPPDEMAELLKEDENDETTA